MHGRIMGKDGNGGLTMSIVTKMFFLETWEWEKM